MLKLPSVLTDHAVLQHSRDVAIWGWTDAGQTLTVQFRDASVTATAGDDGKFATTIPSGSPGGPFDLVLKLGDQTHVLHDLLVGEVWLCSGQSNMEFALREALGSAQEIPQANHGSIRLLTIPQTSAAEPTDDVLAHWVPCTPESATTFSAVAYHFGKHLHQELNIPIGLINSSWGGTTAEAWTRREDLAANKDLAYLAVTPTEPAGPHPDPGISQEASTWMSPDLDDQSWEEMLCPQAWERTGLNIDGAVWFRWTLEIPAEWAGKPLLLSGGVMDDFDQTFFNGHKIGATGPETPSAWSTPRRYTIPAELVQAGKAVIAVRVFDQWGDGGLMGPAELMYLCLQSDEAQRIDLAGNWRYRIELALPPRSPSGAVAPTALFNGMISPLVPYTIAGAIWYQGESNADRAFEYRTLFPTMIRCWREAWSSDFSFLFVLLAGWHAHPTQPVESSWAELRDAQLATLSLPNTAAASAIDLGDIEDIHPKNKRDVGSRLALAALARCYGRDIEYSGPVFQSAQVCGGEARLTFTHAAGLHARGDTPCGFAAAGSDGVYYWATARIEGEQVLLTCPQVGTIHSIRYAWADNPIANLYNAAGLPMLPFRTDTLAYSTAPVAEEYGRLG